MSIRTKLLTLSTAGAFWLFLICVGFGSLSILLSVGVPWVPAAIVMIYGLVLLYATKFLLVQHSESTINSPYFLGFVLFLVSLFKTFWSISVSAEDLQVTIIIKQLGAALLTTIVGLPFRQALFALNPAQADQDLFFRTLEEELRRSATEFRKAQTEMVSMLGEMVEFRKSLFAEERKAATRYVHALENATSFLDGTATDYPRILASALESCNTSLAVFSDQVRQLSQSVGSVDTEKIKQAFANCANVSAYVAELQQALLRLTASYATASSDVSQVPITFAASVEQTASELARIPEFARAQVIVLQNDIKAVDSILGSFISLMQNRVETLN